MLIKKYLKKNLQQQFSVYNFEIKLHTLKVLTALYHFNDCNNSNTVLLFFRALKGMQQKILEINLKP